MSAQDSSAASTALRSFGFASLGMSSIRNWLGQIASGLWIRSDGEHEMAWSRLAYAVAVAVVFAVLAWNGAESSAPSAAGVVIGLLVYLVAAAAIFAHLIRHPEASLPRRAVGLVVDVVMISGFASTFGVAAGFLYPLFVWNALDHGLRFGRRYLIAATLLGNVGLFAALLVTSSWTGLPGLSLMLQAGMVLLPLGIARLIAKSDRTSLPAEEAEEPSAVVASPTLQDAGELDESLRPNADAHQDDDQPEQGAVVAPVRTSTSGVSVLVAEDNSTSQLILRKVLEHAGHRVTIADNGEAAVTKLRTGKFDIALMDINMPVMNGIEATKLYRLASIGRTRVPIVALVTDTSPAAWEVCQEAGMDAWASKPVDPIRLLDVIESMAIRHPLAEDARLLQQTVADEVEDETFAPLAEAPAAQGDAAVVDMDTLDNLEQLGGVEFVQDLVSQFSRDSAQLLNGLHKAVAEKDAYRFRELAHALRSSAANVGATRVFDICLALRAITGKELAADGQAQASQIGDEIARAMSALEARASGANAAAPAESSLAAHG